ncbi:HBS1-like protein [Clytia hemisphaerica]|uniref:Tr-type G domain-containing protein n=1 Tax=Clytia hemisphaerica TaxID=252671 RepID=A0A7M5VFE6_9CNID
MARHRNVRNLDLDDEMYDDFYGRSLEETDFCVSPSTEAEFMFRRDKGHTLSSFIEQDTKIDEKDEENEEEDFAEEEEYRRPQLDPATQEKLQTCIEKIEDIFGDSYHEREMVNAVMTSNYNVEAAVDALINKNTSASASASAVPTPRKPEFFGNNIVINTRDSPKPPSSTQQPSKPQFLESKQSESASSSKPSSGASTPKTDTSRAQSRESLLDDSINRTPKASKSREVIDIPSELKKRQSGKELINLVVIGHVDAGKSTLMGHLLFNLGNVSKRAMHKNEMESKKSGKGSFAFAWVLDETEEERTRGITMDVAMTMFETKTKLVTLLDAPGHRDFIPNMIQGTAQADVAILVVDSRPGEFEAGFDAGGQTREHAILARSLGVGQLIVAVNKMDSINWSKERYDAIVLKMKVFMAKQAGFKESDVSYVPCSGLSGENLTEKAKEPALLEWYKDSSLVEKIDIFSPPLRPIEKPFRLCVSDVYKGQGSFTIAGKVESGSVQNNDRIMVMPAGENGMVKGLTTRDEGVRFAAAGDYITASMHGVDMAHVTVGSIICDVNAPMRTTTKLAARIVIFNIQIPLTKGFMVVFHSQNLAEPATISKLVGILNKNTGEIVQRRPRCLTKQMNAIIEVKFSRPVCVELYRENKVLGRFMLRYSGKTLAAGVITEIK